jgi:hypothetical protein
VTGNKTTAASATAIVQITKLITVDSDSNYGESLKLNSDSVISINAVTANSMTACAEFNTTPTTFFTTAIISSPRFAP